MKRAPKSGFTLLELVVSMATSSILIVGLSSALLIAVKAIDPPTGPIRTAAITLPSHQSLLEELYFAKSLEEREPASLTLTIDDRTRDGAMESIRYAWSGESGDALTKQINGGAEIVLIPNVERLVFSYQTQLGSEGQTLIVSVGIMLQCRQEGGGTLETTINLLNRPELSP